MLDTIDAHREFCKRLLAHDLKTKEEKDAAIHCLIEKATSKEQLHEIGTAIITAVLVSNPHLYRQLDNGNWVLRNLPNEKSEPEFWTLRVGEGQRTD